MLGKLRNRFARSELWSFNPVHRDRWIAAQAARVPKGARILDAGAGSAPYRPLFAHCRYTAQDFGGLEDRQLRHGGYARIDLVCDVAAMPVDDASFDVVLCTEMLEHHPEPVRVVHEFARVLAPGGRLILTAPLGSGIHQEPYHFYGGYTPYWYERFLAEAGFRDIRIEANAGSLRFFAQEAIRFIRDTRPFRLRAGLLATLLWVPCWLVLAPVLGLAVPVAARLLDRYDREQRFTVGYHVTAVRVDAGARSS